MSSESFEVFLWFQGFAVLVALIPFFTGLYHYRLDRKISRAGGRVTGYVADVGTMAEIPEFQPGPDRRRGRSALHTYSIAYQCHNGFTRTMEFYESDRLIGNPGDPIEVAFLYANADIAKPVDKLYVNAYFYFSLAGFFVALPFLVVTFFWVLDKL